MNFSYFIFAASTIFAQQLIKEQIESWLENSTLSINEMINELECSLKRNIKNETKLKPLLYEIKLFREREINEHKTVINLLNDHKHERIDSFISAKLKELEYVKGEYSNYKTRFPCCRIKDIDYFRYEIYDCGLWEKYKESVNYYNERFCGILRPKLYKENEIIVKFKSIISKQIERIQILEIKISDLKNLKITLNINNKVLNDKINATTQ